MTASLANAIAFDSARRAAHAWRAGRPARLSPAALAGVALAHAGLFALLLAVPDAPAPTVPPRPLTVSLIEPAPEPVEPVVVPPPPRPVVQPPRPQPVLAARRPSPAPPQAAVAPPVPETPAPQTPVVQPAPQPVPAPAPAPVMAEIAPPAPPAPMPPRPADYLTNPKPPYPALSRRLGEEGLVRLNVLVNADGSVGRLELDRSSGHPRLDRSAMETVQSSWKFEPARQGGKAVPAWVIVPIQFTLRN